MAEDPVSNLLRKHFKKVNECIKNQHNFDILTRFSFRTTCDKSIDDTDFYTNDEYVNPEFELSQRVPGRNFPVQKEMQQDESMEETESEEFQAETDLDESSTEGQSTEVSSSVYNTTFEEAEQRAEKKEHSELSRRSESSRKSLIQRPETPLLELYDSEDENEYQDATSKKIEGSQKFILHSEQLQTGDLNFSDKTENLRFEESDIKPELLEILPRKDEYKAVYNIPTPEENERAFHEELKMYKRDIKLERTIKSFSCNDQNVLDAPVKNQPTTSSFNECSKSVNHTSKSGLMENLHGFQLNRSIGLGIENKNVPEYLKNYFEEANTNVCGKISRHGELHSDSKNDKDILTFYNPSLSDDSDDPPYERVPNNNYVTMNHLEIQKEMMRRIEDMYKPGDGI